MTTKQWAIVEQLSVQGTKNQTELEKKEAQCSQWIPVTVNLKRPSMLPGLTLRKWNF